MATNIAAALNECLKEFTELTNSGALARYNNEVSKHRWLDELGRLRIWAGNIGAHQTGQSSLDYRLRDASHLKNETVKLLQRLLRLLRDLAEVIKDKDQIEDENDELFFEDSELEVEGDNDMTDIQMLFQSLRNTINLLFQISMSIRRPADHDRLLGVKIKDESYFEPWAQQHISHKFPNATGSIIPRLSAAMARQKAVLKYFERHRAKLGKGLSGGGDIGTQLSETVATEMVLSEDHLQFLETNSTSGISQTSYTPSIFTSNESLSVPNPPKESADENPFECPYCCLVIKIKGKKDWAHHVFRDLMPYVCISAECSTPSKLYESRRKWYDHMRQSHNLQSGSNCPLCQVSLHPPLTFDRHVGHHMEQLALFVVPRPTPSEEDASGTASNVASLEAFRDATTRSNDSIKEVPQTVDNFFTIEIPLEEPPDSFNGLIEETTAGSSSLPYVSPLEYDGIGIPPIQRQVGNSDLETWSTKIESWSTSPDFESRELGYFSWESSENTKEENIYSFDRAEDWMPSNFLDNWPVQRLTMATLHESSHTNDSEGGSPSHDGKKKADDNTGLLQCNWKDCQSMFPSKIVPMHHTKTRHIDSRSFICPVCGRESKEAPNN